MYEEKNHGRACEHRRSNPTKKIGPPRGKTHVLIKLAQTTHVARPIQEISNHQTIEKNQQDPSEKNNSVLKSSTRMIMKPSHDMTADPPPQKKCDYEVTSKNTTPPRQKKNELSQLRAFVNPLYRKYTPKNSIDFPLCSADTKSHWACFGSPKTHPGALFHNSGQC